jgi:hypothetical protein
MEGRVMQLPYRQVPDSLDFQLVRAKLKVGAVASREVLEAFERAAAAGAGTAGAVRPGEGLSEHPAPGRCGSGDGRLRKGTPSRR